jgi:hypothetical protein
VGRAILQVLDVAQQRICVIDSLPVPVVTFHLAPQASREWAAHGATFGKVSSKKQTIYGYKLHLLLTLGGVASHDGRLPVRRRNGCPAAARASAPLTPRRSHW